MRSLHPIVGVESRRCPRDNVRVTKPIVSSTPVIDSRNAQAKRHLRHLFWQNVVQHMLTTFPQRVAENPDLADGRVAVLTREGERIGIKSVQPLFACSVPGGADDRALSLAVQCTIFEIHTPEGQVYTLPLEEIRAVHSLTEDLIDELQKLTGEAASDTDAEPFGFSAFTSLARQQRESEAQDP
jgi:hypothetical protein